MLRNSTIYAPTPGHDCHISRCWLISRTVFVNAPPLERFSDPRHSRCQTKPRQTENKTTRKASPFSATAWMREWSCRREGCALSNFDSRWIIFFGTLFTVYSTVVLYCIGKHPETVYSQILIPENIWICWYTETQKDLQKLSVEIYTNF